MNTGLKLLRPHSPKIVLYGMSCVGKTTFAKTLNEHKYMCFDAMFNWHNIETLDLPIDLALQHVVDNCLCFAKFVLDGWHLADKRCELWPLDVTAYVLYDDYDSIIKRYRIPVENESQHLPMFSKWYDLDIILPTRYFKNTEETTVEEFIVWKQHNQ